MMKFTIEQIQEAKGAKTVEELLDFAKREGLEMNEEEAAEYFAQLHPKWGEIDDDELDNVAGGGCHTSDGYTVVTCEKGCFTGQYKCVRMIYFPGTAAEKEIWENTRDMSLRKLWWESTYSLGEDARKCGRCRYLEFKGGTGYCSKS